MISKAWTAFLCFILISGAGNAIFDNCPVLGSILIYGAAVALAILFYRWDKEDEEE